MSVVSLCCLLVASQGRQIVFVRENGGYLFNLRLEELISWAVSLNVVRCFKFFMLLPSVYACPGEGGR